MTVRSRFAPSPTGYLHIGGARTALFSWLLARKNNGKFVLRIEDTDRERSTEESVQAILQGMEWLGLDYDEGPFYQTERFDRYKEVIDKLLADGNAYYCYCSSEEVEAMREEARAKGEKPRYNGKYRDFTGTPPAGVKPVVRFRSPMTGVVSWDDAVRGPIAINNAELDDLVIARSDGTPTYNLTVVVDDLDMGMTHVLRGDDHINNTPRQINIVAALGGTAPQFAHAPMILGSDGARLSKRHGAVSVMQYRDDGYLPQALLNYLVRLGWSHGDQEVFSVEEMIELFDASDVNKAPSTFNAEKLLWLNQQYIQTLPLDALLAESQWHLQRAGLANLSGVDKALDEHRQKASTLIELVEAIRPYYEELTDYDEKAAAKQLTTDSLPVLVELQKRFATLEKWDRDSLKSVIHKTAEDLGLKMGKVGAPLRIAMLGKPAGADIPIVLELLGAQKCADRLTQACNFIQSR